MHHLTKSIHFRTEGPGFLRTCHPKGVGGDFSIPYIEDAVRLDHRLLRLRLERVNLLLNVLDNLFLFFLEILDNLFLLLLDALHQSGFSGVGVSTVSNYLIGLFCPCPARQQHQQHANKNLFHKSFTIKWICCKVKYF